MCVYSCLLSYWPLATHAKKLLQTREKKKPFRFRKQHKLNHITDSLKFTASIRNAIIFECNSKICVGRLHLKLSVFSFVDRQIERNYNEKEKLFYFSEPLQRT